MHRDIESVLITESQIKDRIAKLGAIITKEYAGSDLYMVCVLKGAMICFADLLREVGVPVTIDCIAASSYGRSSQSSGNVRITWDLTNDIKDKNVLLVEDIVDTGLTLAHVMELLSARQPKSLKLFSLLDKPSRRKVHVNIDYLGFTIPDAFVVGYGLDYAHKYRNLKDICILKHEIYSN